MSRHFRAVYRELLVIAMPHNNTSRHRIKEVLRRRLETAGMSGCVGHVVPANVVLGYTLSLSGGCGVTGVFAQPRRSVCLALGLVSSRSGLSGRGPPC
jgi:hypothetical protein